MGSCAIHRFRWYEQVDGTWVIQPSAQYFINNATNSGELEYTDERDRFTLIVFNATLTTSANNTIVTTTFTQNGTPNLDYEIIRTKATAMDQEAISISADLRLSDGDTIGVAVKADKTGTVTFVKAHMTAVNVYYVVLPLSFTSSNGYFSWFTSSLTTSSHCPSPSVGV